MSSYYDSETFFERGQRNRSAQATERESLQNQIPSLQSLNEELAKRKLDEFIRFTKQDYVPDEFHLQLCRIVEQFFFEVEAKKSPRYIIVAPPQHGKTQHVSRHGPAWAMGRWPNWYFIGSTYNQSWADDICRDVQKIMDSDEYRHVFPGVKIPAKGSGGSAKRVSDYFELIECCPRCGSEDWTTLQRDPSVDNSIGYGECNTCGNRFIKKGNDGRYKAAGRGASPAGRPAHVLIIDDLLKGYEEAMSDVIRESAWQSYANDLRPRVQQGGGVLMMFTRWHEDDPIGRAIEQMKGIDDPELRDNWKTFHFQALYDPDSPEPDNQAKDWRKPGQALAPHRFNEKSLLTTKNTSSPALWNALYQGHPVPLEGNIFLVDRWKYFSVFPEISAFDLIIQSWDATFKETTSADYVAGHVYGIIGAYRFLLDRVYAQMGLPNLVQAVREMKARWPMCSHILIEDKANGPAVIQTLTAEIPGLIAVEPLGSKVARAWASSGDQAAGNCWLPEPGMTIVRPPGVLYGKPYSAIEVHATWVVEFRETLKKFPTVKHDDDVDAFSQAINWVRLNSFGLLTVWKQQYEAQQRALVDAGNKTADQIKRELGDAQLRAAADLPGASTMAELARKRDAAPSTLFPKPAAPTPRNAECPNCQNKNLTRYGDMVRCVCGWSNQGA